MTKPLCMLRFALVVVCQNKWRYNYINDRYENGNKYFIHGEAICITTTCVFYYININLLFVIVRDLGINRPVNSTVRRQLSRGTIHHCLCNSRGS